VGGGGGLGGISRPDGVDEKDALKDFHHALEVQATAQQIADFQELLKATTSVQERVHEFATAGRGTAGVTTLDKTLQDARARGKSFQDGLSDKQRSGLKEITKRMEKADADLGQEGKLFDQIVQSEGPASDISSRAASLDKVLTEFSNVELALGREMGITLASGQDLAFNLPAVRTEVNAGNRSIAIDTSGSLTQTAAEGDRRTFRVESRIDLSELQRAITEVVNARVTSRACGTRLFVKRATLGPTGATSSAELQLHYERWSCSQSSGPTELAEADGSVEVGLTLSVNSSGILSVAPEFKRITATGMMAEDLRSGDVGDVLRSKLASLVLTTIQAGGDFKSAMPAVLQNGVTLQSARFESGVGSTLRVLLEGQVQLSDEQVTALANQLNEKLSAREAPTAAPNATPTAPSTK